ncbi:MBL fold metallo-hydrolase [Amphibacillus sp. Q70]|uniref:MBL fold metallo-hydrolase n=1 Tax=Amphibacillus sp. Q70 TaxID=3453416 RepID=UPI003F824833
MKFNCLPLGQLTTNCYIVSENNQALIIDPGAESERIVKFLTDNDLTPIAILLTHAHFDHIGAVDDIREYYHIPVYLHSLEKEWLMNPKLNSSIYFPLGDVKINSADHLFDMGDMSLGAFQFEVIHTPGHSPGGVTFIFAEQTTIISGDCLFREGMGRTDLVGGDQSILFNSIRELYKLPKHYKVLPGHGPDTTIGYEKDHNPFIKG